MLPSIVVHILWLCFFVLLLIVVPIMAIASKETAMKFFRSVYTDIKDESLTTLVIAFEIAYLIGAGTQLLIQN